MSESEILAFNSKFDTYAGTQRGSSIKAMASRIWIANKELGDNADVVKLNVDGHQVTEGSDPDVVTTKYYNVTITKSPSTGLIIQPCHPLNKWRQLCFLFPLQTSFRRQNIRNPRIYCCRFIKCFCERFKHRFRHMMIIPRC